MKWVLVPRNWSILFIVSVIYTIENGRSGKENECITVQFKKDHERDMEGRLYLLFKTVSSPK